MDSTAKKMDLVAGRILVVDDDPILLKVIETSLRKAGLEASCVNSLDSARERIANEPAYDAVVCDIHLDNEDGRDLVPWLRARGLRTRVFLMSGDHVVPENEFATLGSDGFLHKPFRIERLVLKLVLLAQHTPIG